MELPPKKPHLIYILGGTDTGKSTLARELLSALKTRDGGKKRKKNEWAFLDADPGQSSIGPPTTIGLAPVNRRGTGETRGEENTRFPYLRFAGATSPSKAFSRTIDSLSALAKAGKREFGNVVLDSCGLIEGEFGLRFQLSSIRTVSPDYIIALRREDELGPLLEALGDEPGGCCVITVQTGGEVTEKSQSKRKLYRENRFKKYFENPQSLKVPLQFVQTPGPLPDFTLPEEYRGRLCAICDGELRVRSLGVTEELHGESGGGLYFNITVPDRYSKTITAELRRKNPDEELSRRLTLLFGDIYLDPDTGEEKHNED